MVKKVNVPWNKGKKGIMPEPWNKGKKLSKSARKKLSESHKGQIPWNKGKKGIMPEPWNKGTYLSYKKASKIVQKLKIQTQIEYRKISKAKKLPKGIPSEPYEVYTRSGEWNGWPDYLRGGKKLVRPSLPPQERKRRKALSDKKYREKNTKALAEKSKQYRSRPEIITRIKRRQKEYHVKNAEKIRKRVKEWQKNNRLRYNDRNRKWNYDRKYEVLSYYSKKQSKSDIPCCSCCGENQFLIFLTIDHIAGRKYTDDYVHTNEKKARNALAGSRMYAKLIKEGFPDGYRVLCWNCNSARDKQPDKICPHQRGKQ